MRGVLLSLAFLLVIAVPAQPNNSILGTNVHTDFVSDRPREITVYYDYLENGQLKGGVVTLLRPTTEPGAMAKLLAEWPVTTVVDNGPPSNRLDLVFLGDGYTTSELNTYATHVQTILATFLADPPLDAYSNYFNVHRVDVVSNESGVDEPDYGIYRDTALDMTYNCSGIPRLLCVDVDEALVAAQNAPDSDMILALANSERYGGAGYVDDNLATAAGGNELAAELSLHEFGHSFANLADEYHYNDGAVYSGPDPDEQNVSIYDASQQLALQKKWYRWLDVPDVDTFEGAYYHEYGIYRPTFTSKMNSLGEPFKQVNAEQFIINIYKFVSAIDDATPVSEDPLPADTTFFVTPMQPTHHSLDVQWSIDGVNVPGATALTFTPDGNSLETGTHQVGVLVVDNTPMVRDESTRATWMAATRQWLISVSTQGTDYLVMDDMEFYDDSGNLIYNTWIDGWTNYTGSLVEIVIAPNEPVHWGEKSMEYMYDNTGYTSSYCYSEAERPIPEEDKDWTEGGVKALSLWFHGDANNDPEQMYLALGDGSKEAVVKYDGDINDVNIADWKEWNIDLQDFKQPNQAPANDVNLASINSFYIGFGDREHPQQSGTAESFVYFDDIRLYIARCVAEYGPEADLSGDCVVYLEDLKIMADEWLSSGIKADLVEDNSVDFKDYAVLTDSWLDEKWFPEGP